MHFSNYCRGDFLSKYQVVSLHFDSDCNQNCPICYRNKNVPQDKKTDYKFWIECIPYLKKITDQVALGGGEPMLHQDFIKEFAAKAKEHNLIVNVTTNGTVPIEPDTLKNVTMVSVSYDQYKWKGGEGFRDYIKRVKEIKEKYKVKVGCNLLMEDWLFKNYQTLMHIVLHMFLFGKVDAVFALTPKNYPAPDILKHKKIYQILTYLFDDFYVDDCAQSIIVNDKIKKWKKPCHYALDMVSIDEERYVRGCSFSKDSIMRLEKPEDILKIPKAEFKRRYECPYYEVNQDEEIRFFRQ